MNSTSVYDLVVIGGGAAGFFGAVTFAADSPGARVCILEKAAVPLGKVRISGGGRCNLTHACFDPAQLVQYYPRGARELRGAFTRFQPRDTIEWFESRGVPLKTESDGRVFPVSDRSENIIACLTSQAARTGVEVRCLSPVSAVRRAAEGAFQVELRQGDFLSTRSLLLASGGDRAGMALAGSLGHPLVPPVPSLFTFTIPDPRLSGLEGVSVPAAHLALPSARLDASGPLLITHWGLSGPAVLRLSAWGARALHEAGYRMPLLVNWIPPHNPETILGRLNELRAAESRRLVLAHSPLPDVPLRLWKALASTAGVPETLTWANLSRAQLTGLAEQLTRCRFEIQGKGQFKEEFVTCGGGALRGVGFRRMQSPIFPGLYLAGEILDIDGLTGGFNFQSAWTTAWLAGRGIGNQS